MENVKNQLVDPLKLFVDIDEELPVTDELHEDSVGFFNRLIRQFETWFYSIICMTSKTYERILAGTEHPADCIAVYTHLLWTGRRQKTNSVKAKSCYLQKGLKLSEKRIKRAKVELHRLGLIEYRQNKGKNAQFGENYVIVKYIPSFKGASGAIPTPTVSQGAGGPISTPPETHPTGNDGQMLKENNKMLKERKENNNVVPFVTSKNPETTPLYDEFQERYGKTIPKELEIRYPVAFERCLRYMLQLPEETGGRIKNALGYLTKLLKSPETVNEVEETEVDPPLPSFKTEELTEEQREQCRAYNEWYTDVVSGRKAEREEKETRKRAVVAEVRREKDPGAERQRQLRAASEWMKKEAAELARC